MKKTGSIVTGFYALPELDRDHIDTIVNYPVQVVKLESPHLAFLYAENNRLHMSTLTSGDTDFEDIKRFCMLSPQEERFFHDFCASRDAVTVCEVRAPEYNLTRWQASSISPILVLPKEKPGLPNPADLGYLEACYDDLFFGMSRETGFYSIRTVTEPTSLSLASDLAVWEPTSPGVIVADSMGVLYRVTSREWEVRNKLLEDLYEDLQEGGLRRLTYPRVDDHEEYYRKRMEYQLAEKNPDLWDSLSRGDVPLWEVLNVVDRTHITYRTWKTVMQ